MAAECTETSVVNPNPNSSSQNWWHEIMHANSLCSWTTPGNGGGGVSLVASSNNNFPWQHSSNNHSSESSGEDDVSISNQSVLTAESSRQLVDGGGAALAGELIGETTSDQNHLWSHFLLSGGSTRGGMEYKSHHPQQVVGEGMLNLSSSSSTNLDIMSNCDDYLKKMGTAAYEFNLSTAALKDPGGFINHPFGGGGGHETQRPPAGMLDHHHHQPPPPPMFAAGHPCGQLHDVSCICSNTNHNNNNNNNPSRELNDFSASFQSYLSKPLLDINHEYKPTLKTLQYLSSSSPAGYITKKNAAAGLRPSPSRASTCSTLTRSHGRGQGIVGNEGRKKKTEDNAEKMNLKRPKNNDNPASKVPKVKLADKITALQQIVSPFGKTDTASVLWEAIGHIRFLQEQIQLLTNAYAKSNARKDVPWGGLLVDGRKDGGGDAKVVDLRSRGLCLVPISYTPQIYRESNASDYLIPTYRGCLYG